MRVGVWDHGTALNEERLKKKVTPYRKIKLRQRQRLKDGGLMRKKDLI